jgi:hypothetical protein
MNKQVIGSLVYPNDNNKKVEFYSREEILTAFEKAITTSGPNSVYPFNMPDETLAREMFVIYMKEIGEDIYE